MEPWKEYPQARDDRQQALEHQLGQAGLKASRCQPSQGAKKPTTKK